MRRGLLAAALALCALAAAIAWGSEPAPASHGGSGGAGPGRYPGCYMTPGANPTLPGRLALPGERCVVATARNVVGETTRAAQPIAVCAASDYKASTMKAIQLLNAYSGWGTLFRWAGVISDPDNPDASPCKHETASGWVSSVVVTNDYYTGSATQPEACRASRALSPGFACVRHFTVRGAPHYGFIGRAEIRIHPDLDVVTADNLQYGTCAPEGHEKGASYNPATAKLRICTDASAVQPGRADGTLELTRHVAHELMHIVGLRDYSCEAWPLKAGDGTVTRTLMDTLFRPDCRSPLLASPAARKAGTGALVTSWDRADYTALYSPAAVTGLRVTATDAGLRVSWTAGHVHVEQGFAVERRVGTAAWQRVTLAPANAASVTIDKPTAATSYRVASLTSAFGTAADSYATSATPATVTYTPPVKPTTPGGTDKPGGTDDPGGDDDPGGTDEPGGTDPPKPSCDDDPATADIPPCPETCWNGTQVTPPATCPVKPSCDDDPATADIPPCPETCWNGTQVTPPATCPVKPSCDDDPATADIPPCPVKPPTPPTPPTSTPTATPTATATPKPQPTHTCWNGVKVFSPDECEPEPPRCFDPFFNEVPCPTPDPCSQPGFPGCSRPPDPVEPPETPQPPEVALPPRPRELAGLVRA